MRNELAEEITRLVSIPDVLKRYGYDTGRNKRIPCPLHDGKNANFSYTDHVYHCWTCGASGNVIQLVMHLFGLRFGQALVKINCDFGLGLASQRPAYRERIQMQEERKIREAEKRFKMQRREEYLSVCNLYRVLYTVFLSEVDISGLSEYLDKLEQWLDEHIGEVRN